jgi:hypothetical protein
MESVPFSFELKEGYGFVSDTNATTEALQLALRLLLAALWFIEPNRTIE